MEKEILIANKIIYDLSPTIETIENELFKYIVFYYAKDFGLKKLEYRHYKFSERVKKILKEKI